MLQTSSGVFSAQTKALYTISWTGYSSATATFWVSPTISTYGLTLSAANGVAYLPGVAGTAGNGVFTTTMILPMAVGDAVLLATDTSGISVKFCSLSITAQPLGAF